jgi:hypothetical protein
MIGTMRHSAEPPVSPIAPGLPAREQETLDATTAASCDYCGSARLEWRKCKLICEDCKQINKSCADL